ncbi:glycosyltransferase family 9 protein [Candidatus Omnitrophota bacterium]
MEHKKILVIKMGYSETLDQEMTKTVSLGDVLRCTVILEPLKERFSNSHITWLVSNEAVPLVNQNKYIDRLLVWDEFTPYVLMREKFDIVINLEKIDGVCALTDMIDAWERIGFRFNSQAGTYDTYLQSVVAKEYIQDKTEKGQRNIWQKIIIEMIGAQWKKQEYSLGYKPKTEEKCDVGFNYYVGTKWPTKAMPEKKWKELEKLLKKQGRSVSWQKGMNNLYEYMDWINTCRTVVTSDSLGLHLALALKKNVIVLFGATDDKEIFLYNRGVAIKPQVSYDCLPCYLSTCRQKKHCMDFLEVKQIAEEIKKRM